MDCRDVFTWIYYGYNTKKDGKMTPRRFTSMAQQRRFERQQNEIEKLRKAKAKDVDGKVQGTDNGTSGDQEGSNPPAAETKSEEKQ